MGCRSQGRKLLIPAAESLDLCRAARVLQSAVCRQVRTFGGWYYTDRPLLRRFLWSRRILGHAGENGQNRGRLASYQPLLTLTRNLLRCSSLSQVEVNDRWHQGASPLNRMALGRLRAVLPCRVVMVWNCLNMTEKRPADPMGLPGAAAIACILALAAKRRCVAGSASGIGGACGQTPLPRPSPGGRGGSRSVLYCAWMKPPMRGRISVRHLRPLKMP